MPIISEACWFYHWSFEEVLKMDCRVFFKMIEEARKIRITQRIEDCRIAMIPIYVDEYGKGLIEDYASMMPKDPEQIEKIREAAEAAVLSGEDAQNAMRAMFRR